MGLETSSLQREIKQARPFASLGQEAIVGLLRTADVVRRRLQEIVEPHGITLQQYNVLRILRGAGEEGLPTLEIAARMVERMPGITRLLDRLERVGLVRRERGPGDRRQVRCQVRQRGLRVLEALDQPIRGADHACLGELTEAQRQTLVHLLDRVRAEPG
jgi:MarR family transcriptional regulator, organic hydroperoxide resistance regulator